MVTWRHCCVVQSDYDGDGEEGMTCELLCVCVCQSDDDGDGVEGMMFHGSKRLSRHEYSLRMYSSDVQVGHLMCHIQEQPGIEQGQALADISHSHYLVIPFTDCKSAQ